MYTITAEEIEQAATGKSIMKQYGFDEYVKVNGQWVLDHILFTDKENRQTRKVYTDNRPTEIINWAK